MRKDLGYRERGPVMFRVEDEESPELVMGGTVEFHQGPFGRLRKKQVGNDCRDFSVKIREPAPEQIEPLVHELAKLQKKRLRYRRKPESLVPATLVEDFVEKRRPAAAAAMEGQLRRARGNAAEEAGRVRRPFVISPQKSFSQFKIGPECLRRERKTRAQDVEGIGEVAGHLRENRFAGRGEVLKTFLEGSSYRSGEGAATFETGLKEPERGQHGGLFK